MFHSERQGYRPLAKDEEDTRPATKLEDVGAGSSCSAANFKMMFLVLVTINILVIGGGLSWKQGFATKPAALSRGLFPRISRETKLFTPNETFYKALGAGKEEDWESLFPYGSGFVRVDDPQQFGLSGGYPLESSTSETTESFCVSVFHQLHCLNSIRFQLENPGKTHEGHGHDKLSAHANELHVAHCLDYLRQSIMCAGDMSLESAVTDKNGKLIQAVSGWGATHTCKAWDEVFEYTERINAWGHRRGESLPK